MLLSALRWLDPRLRRLSRSTVLLSALLLAVAVGAADHFIAVDLLIFYLIPLFGAAWYGGRREGSVIAIYSATAGFLTGSLVNGWTVVSPEMLGDLLIRLLAFIGLSMTFARLREAKVQQEELTSFLVHDLRSPLASAITGLMTLDQTADTMGESEREMVQLALVSNQRALGLVNSILDVAKMESGTMPVSKETVVLEPFLEECFRLVALWAQGQNVTLIPDIRRETAVFDKHLTERVLVNMLSNALKYSPSGSSVTVRINDDPHGVLFEVIDHGPGIPAEYVDAIFDPFGQVAGTKGGTGLGLTFCRLAVKAQGGRIGVHSELGKGSTFWFTLHLQGLTS